MFGGIFGLSDIALWFLAFTLLCWLLNKVGDQSVEWLRALNTIIYDPFHWIEENLRSGLIRAWKWLGKQLGISGEDNKKSLLSRIVGGIVATSCCSVFICNDILLFSGILAGMGVGSEAISIPIDKSLLSAASICCSALVTGLFMTDALGITDLGPFSRINNRYIRAGAAFICAILMMGSLLVATHLADWRVSALQESAATSAPSQEIDINALLQGPAADQGAAETALASVDGASEKVALHHQGMALKGISLLSLLNTALAFTLVGEFASLILMGVIAGLLSIPSAVLPVIILIRLAIQAVHNFLSRTLNVCLAWGERVDSWLLKAWEQIKTATGRRDKPDRTQADAKSTLFEQNEPKVDFAFSRPDPKPATRTTAKPPDGVVDMGDYARARAEGEGAGQITSAPVCDSDKQAPLDFEAVLDGAEEAFVPEIQSQDNQPLPEAGFDPYQANNHEKRN